MSLLKNLETKANVEGEKDVLGGGGVLDTNVYPCLLYTSPSPRDS